MINRECLAIPKERNKWNNDLNDVCKNVIANISIACSRKERIAHACKEMKKCKVESKFIKKIY